MPNETTKASTDAELIAELRQALEAALEWIDAVPKEAPLPPMPGFDREWADSLLTHVPGQADD